MRANRTREERLAKARRLRAITQDTIYDMMTIVDGRVVMDNDTFRMLLRNNANLRKRYDTLVNRQWKLERMIWKVA